MIAHHAHLDDCFVCILHRDFAFSRNDPVNACGVDVSLVLESKVSSLRVVLACH